MKLGFRHPPLLHLHLRSTVGDAGSKCSRTVTEPFVLEKKKLIKVRHSSLLDITLFYIQVVPHQPEFYGRKSLPLKQGRARGAGTQYSIKPEGPQSQYWLYQSRPEAYSWASFLQL